jgi:hypothetical protein
VHRWRIISIISTPFGNLLSPDTCPGEGSSMRNIAYVFLVLAVAFIVIGFSGQRTFIFVGLAFLVVAMLRFLPRRPR